MFVWFQYLWVHAIKTCASEKKTELAKGEKIMAVSCLGFPGDQLKLVELPSTQQTTSTLTISISFR